MTVTSSAPHGLGERPFPTGRGDHDRASALPRRVRVGRGGRRVAFPTAAGGRQQEGRAETQCEEGSDADAGARHELILRSGTRWTARTTTCGREDEDGTGRPVEPECDQEPGQVHDHADTDRPHGDGQQGAAQPPGGEGRKKRQRVDEESTGELDGSGDGHRDQDQQHEGEPVDPHARGQGEFTVVEEERDVSTTPPEKSRYDDSQRDEQPQVGGTDRQDGPPEQGEGARRVDAGDGQHEQGGGDRQTHQQTHGT